MSHAVRRWGLNLLKCKSRGNQLLKPKQSSPTSEYDLILKISVIIVLLECGKLQISVRYFSCMLFYVFSV
jgi:hypothetical protein